MKVELSDVWGRTLGRNKKVKLPKYNVSADGNHVGFIGWRKGSKLVIQVPMGPVEIRELEQQVSSLLERKVEARVPPDVPVEMLEPYDFDEDIAADDFD